MKKIFLPIIILLFLIPIVFAQSSYYQFKDCDLSGQGDCEDFEYSYPTQELEFKVRIHPYYYLSDSQIYKITSIAIDNYYSYGYDSNRGIICNTIKFGKEKLILSDVPLEVTIDEWFYVKTTGCNVVGDTWLDAILSINYDLIRQDTYAETATEDIATAPMPLKPSTTRTITGRIRKFIETPEYRQKQFMNRYIYRFIPVVIIAIFSLLGLIRVKR